jgi:hypothetical protein
VNPGRIRPDPTSSNKIRLQDTSQRRISAHRPVADPPTAKPPSEVTITPDASRSMVQTTGELFTIRPIEPTG